MHLILHGKLHITGQLSTFSFEITVIEVCLAVLQGIIVPAKAKGQPQDNPYEATSLNTP
jgi:hypothetical protein